MSPYEITPLEEVHQPQAIELWRLLWSPSAKTCMDYFEWKYGCNPYAEAPLVFVAVIHGEVVGVRGLLTQLWQAGEHQFPVALAGDLVIAPAHRRRGLLARLTERALEEAAQQGIDWALNMSASPTAGMGLMASGWKSIGAIASYSSRQTWRGALARRLRRVLPAQRRPLRRSRGDHLSNALEPRVADMAALVSRLGSDGRLRHLRDERWFAWRFGNPIAEYSFVFWDDDDLQGYLVLSEQRSATSTWRGIVDWEFCNGEIARRLLDEALRLIAGDKVFVWARARDGAIVGLLESRGFRCAAPGGATEYRPRVLVRPTRPTTTWVVGGRPVLDTGSWDLRMSYSDGW